MGLPWRLRSAVDQKKPKDGWIMAAFKAAVQAGIEDRMSSGPDAHTRRRCKRQNVQLWMAVRRQETAEARHPPGRAAKGPDRGTEEGFETYAQADEAVKWLNQ